MPHILLVMHKPGNIRVLTEALEAYNYCCTGATTGEALHSALRQNPPPDLAVVDADSFGVSIGSICEALEQLDMPFIVLSAKQARRVTNKTLRYGTVSIVKKPVVKEALLRLIYDITQDRVRA